MSASVPLPTRAGDGDEKVGENNPHVKTKLSSGAPIIHSINGRLRPTFLTSFLFSDCQNNIFLKELGEKCKIIRSKECSSRCMVAFRWNAYHSLRHGKIGLLLHPPHSLSSILIVLVLVLGMPTMIYCLCLPLEYLPLDTRSDN